MWWFHQSWGWEPTLRLLILGESSPKAVLGVFFRFCFLQNPVFVLPRKPLNITHSRILVPPSLWKESQLQSSCDVQDDEVMCTCQSLPTPLTKTYPVSTSHPVLSRAGGQVLSPRGPPQPSCLPCSVFRPPCSLLDLILSVLPRS